MSFARNLLNIIVLLCVYLDMGLTEGALKRESGKVDYHTIQLSSLSPSSSCVLSIKEYNTKSSLRVVHKHGACSPLRRDKAVKLDHADILRRDQARVHSKLSNNLEYRLTQTDSKDIPVKDESKSEGDLGSGSYIVTIGIGTPEHSQPLIVDTGSELTWTKCRQNKLVFNPSSSTSFNTVPSTSRVCSDFRYRDIDRDCPATRCCYRINYNDKSSSNGYLAEDKFTITSADVFDGIHFGCSENEAKINSKTAGLLGLSRHILSFPSQTATTYNNIFSYCLPSSGRTGLLTFGSSGVSESVKFTPMVTLPNKPYLYGIGIVGITVGGKRLEIPSTVFSNPRAIIDSGTVITRLPPKAYAALRSAFKEKMQNYTTASAVELLDTCYDPKGFDTMAVPKVSFSFGGGTDVELGLNGILYPFDASHLCLAFAGNDNDGEFAIFGSVQQMTLQVVYDTAGGRVGFAQNGCS